MDITPNPTIHVPVVNTLVDDFNIAHTCRDFSKFKDYVRMRVAADAKRPKRSESEYAGMNIPRVGYIMNEDAVGSWNLTRSEYM